MLSFSRRFTSLSLRFLDALLPRQTRLWPIGDRFRARSAALIIFVGFIAILLHIVQLHLEEAQGMLLWTGYMFLSFISFGMMALKLVAKPQLVGTAYIVLLFLVTVWVTVQHARSVFGESFYWYPVLILALFLVSRPRLAAWLGSSIILISQLMIFYLQKFGLQHQFAVSFEQYIMRMASTLLLGNFSILVLVLAFMGLTRTNRMAWKREKEWQLQAARMRELSELASSAALLMERPLQHLQKQHASLLESPFDQDQDTIILRHMGMELQQITRVSESFSLLARSRQEEEIELMEAGHWLQHLTHIILRRVTEKSWDLQIRFKPDDLSLVGPMGRLSLLMVLSLQETFDNQAPGPGSPLQISISDHPDHILIMVAYALPNDRVKDKDQINQSLIDELLSSMGGVMYRSEEYGQVCIRIVGPWHEGQGPSA
jgi:hypothetical protein